MSFAKEDALKEKHMTWINQHNTQDNRHSIREAYQARETSFLSRFACPSSMTKGRRKKEEPCSMRTPFQIDRDRIVYSNAFRRLKYKTQVFLSPMGDHYRTRLTHTLEVSQIARNISRALRLNEDLAEAVALGHDLGHTPFGHGGETALQEIYSSDFSHADQSLRVVDILDNKGKGLNLTKEVRDGILKHSKGFGDIMPSAPGETASTVEGKIVRIADIIAYLNHDLDDAIRSGVITADDIPTVCVKELGKTHSERARTMIQDIVCNTIVNEDKLELSMGKAKFSAMSILRQFLYKNVYRSPSVHSEFIKAKKILTELYHHFLNNPDRLQVELKKMELAAWDPCTNSLERSACDAIASMTDRYAMEVYSRTFLPKPHV